jgi:hypothetical protein
MTVNKIYNSQQFLHCDACKFLTTKTNNNKRAFSRFSYIKLSYEWRHPHTVQTAIKSLLAAVLIRVLLQFLQCSNTAIITSPIPDLAMDSITLTDADLELTIRVV